jgi:hypothetical protein
MNLHLGKNSGHSILGLSKFWSHFASQAGATLGMGQQTQQDQHANWFGLVEVTALLTGTSCHLVETARFSELTLLTSSIRLARMTYNLGSMPVGIPWKQCTPHSRHAPMVGYWKTLVLFYFGLSEWMYGSIFSLSRGDSPQYKDYAIIRSDGIGILERLRD